MSMRAGFDHGETPFLSEMPLSFAEGEEGEGMAEAEQTEEEWEAEVQALARQLDPAAREHLERALARDAGEVFEADAAEAEPEAASYEGFELEAGGTAVSREATFAVPPFSSTERGRFAQPFLGAAAAAKAVEKNQKLAAASGVSADALRAALADYVDLDALARALAAAGISPGRLPFDSVLIEAIRSFQSKTYFNPKAADGVAGGSTLASLGFIRHTLSRGDVTYAPALVELNAKAPQIETALGGRFKVSRWYADFINPAVFGHVFTFGVHPSLIEVLRRAERHLLAQPGYAGLAPVKLGDKLGFTVDLQSHSGGRKNPSISGSFHARGLAIDILANRNPWIAGQVVKDEKTGEKKPSPGSLQFIAVMERATLLMQGKKERIDAAFLSRLSTLPTPAICAQLRGLSELLKQYLALAKSDNDRRAAIVSQQAARGVLTGGESLDRAVERWGNEIGRDLRTLSGPGNFSPGRDPRKGFFDLPTDLVVALRDHAGLAWGAVDFGATESGDVMHFDMRCQPVGKVLRPHDCPRALGGAAPAPAPRSVPGKPKKKTAKPRKALPTASEVSSPAATAMPASRIDPPGKTLYVRAPVQEPGKMSWVGIYVPEKFRARPDVDLVIYLHGLLGPCASPGPSIDRYWDTGLANPKLAFGQGPSALREALLASGKNAILVAPSLGTYGMASALTRPGGFDALIEAVFKALRERAGLSVEPQAVRHIVLAGHSKAGQHMRGIVGAKDAMFMRIRQVWGFDCFYSDGDPIAWVGWAKPSNERRFFHYYIVGRDKYGQPFGPWKRTEMLREMVKKERVTNIELIDVKKVAGSKHNHCSTPMAFFQKRLEASTFLAGL